MEVIFNYVVTNDKILLIDYSWSCKSENSYLRQVGGFLQILRFPPPIKLTAKI